MKNEDLGPNKKYYKEDNLQYAQEIVSMFPAEVREEYLNASSGSSNSFASSGSSGSSNSTASWPSARDRNGRRERQNNCYNGYNGYSGYNGYNGHEKYGKNRASGNRPTRPARLIHIRTDFSLEEKAEILSRVRLVGIERAALEAGTSKEIVMQWLKIIDDSISESVSDFNSEWEEEFEAEYETEHEADYDTDTDDEAEFESGDIESGDMETDFEISETAKENLEIDREIDSVIDSGLDSKNVDRGVDSNIAFQRIKKIKQTRKHYKKPIEKIVAILARAEKVGTKQAARELGATRVEISRWRKIFPKAIWDQVKQWAQERENEKNENNTESRVSETSEASPTSGTSDISSASAPKNSSLRSSSLRNSHSLGKSLTPEIIIARANEVGDEHAAQEFKITLATVNSLRKRVNPDGKLKAVRVKRYTKLEKSFILDRIKEIGIKQASIEFGVSLGTINNWLKKAGRSKYKTCTFKEKIIILNRAEKVGVKQAAEEYKIKPETIKSWLRQAGWSHLIELEHRKHTQEEKSVIIARAEQVGAKRAAAEYNLHIDTVRLWRREAGKPKFVFRTSEEKAAVVSRSYEIGVKNTAQETGISYHTIILWRSKSKVESESMAKSDSELMAKLKSESAEADMGSASASASASVVLEEDRKRQKSIRHKTS